MTFLHFKAKSQAVISGTVFKITVPFPLFFPNFLLFVFGMVPGFQLFGIPPEIIPWLKLGGLRKETERVTVNPYRT